MITRFLPLVALMLPIAALPTGAFAQDAPTAAKSAADNQAILEGLATNVCQSTFTSGKGAGYMKFCITENGNVAKFESPQGYSQMYAEGYGVCDTTASPLAHYDHEFGASGNWTASTIVQPKGPNTFPLTIVRSTSDGIWTLTQTFSRTAASQTIKIVLALTNNSAGTRNAILQRYADVDADGSGNDDYSDTTDETAWTYHSSMSINHGLALRAVPGNTFTRSAAVIAPGGSDSCTRFTRTGPYFGDSALEYAWFLFNIGPGDTRTVTVEYRAM
jgi:hypothetical protein